MLAILSTTGPRVRGCGCAERMEKAANCTRESPGVPKGGADRRVPAVQVAALKSGKGPPRWRPTGRFGKRLGDPERRWPGLPRVWQTDAAMLRKTVLWTAGDYSEYSAKIAGSCGFCTSGCPDQRDDARGETSVNGL